MSGARYTTLCWYAVTTQTADGRVDVVSMAPDAATADRDASDCGPDRLLSPVLIFLTDDLDYPKPPRFPK